MSGQPIGPGDDIHELARRKVVLVVVYFMSRKNITGSILDCEEIAAEIVRNTEPDILYRIVNAPDAAIDRGLIKSVSYALDLLGTAWMIRIFAYAGNIRALSLDDIGPMARRMLTQLEAREALSGPWVWQGPDEIEAAARHHLAEFPIVDLRAIEAAVGRAFQRMQDTGCHSSSLAFTHLEPQPDDQTLRMFTGVRAMAGPTPQRAGNDA